MKGRDVPDTVGGGAAAALVKTLTELPDDLPQIVRLIHKSNDINSCREWQRDIRQSTRSAIFVCFNHGPLQWIWCWVGRDLWRHLVHPLHNDDHRAGWFADIHPRRKRQPPEQRSRPALLRSAASTAERIIHPPLEGKPPRQRRSACQRQRPHQPHHLHGRASQPRSRWFYIRL